MLLLIPRGRKKSPIETLGDEIQWKQEDFVFEGKLSGEAKMNLNGKVQLFEGHLGYFFS
jgi:hypothetical protein